LNLVQVSYFWLVEGQGVVISWYKNLSSTVLAIWVESLVKHLLDKVLISFAEVFDNWLLLSFTAILLIFFIRVATSINVLVRP